MDNSIQGVDPGFQLSRAKVELNAGYSETRKKLGSKIKISCKKTKKSPMLMGVCPYLNPCMAYIIFRICLKCMGLFNQWAVHKFLLKVCCNFIFSKLSTDSIREAKSLWLQGTLNSNYLFILSLR